MMRRAGRIAVDTVLPAPGQAYRHTEDIVAADRCEDRGLCIRGSR